MWKSIIEEHGNAIKAEKPTQRELASRYGITRYQARRILYELGIGAHPHATRYREQPTASPREPQDAASLIDALRALREPVKPTKAQRTQTKGTRILVIPDAHADPDHGGFDRFTILGREIQSQAEQCEAIGHKLIVNSVGDWADMASLSAWDRGKGVMEGRRLLADFQSSKRAIALTMAEIDPAIMSKIDFHIQLGNHENRINKALQENIQLHGIFSTQDLGFEAAGWTVAPFRKPVTHEGVSFVHYIETRAGRALGGVSVGRRGVKKIHSSFVVGHSHILDYYTETRLDGSRVHGLSAGCYFDHDHEFAGQSNAEYWRGLCVLHDVRAGDYDLQLRSMRSLKSDWS